MEHTPIIPQPVREFTPANPRASLARLSRPLEDPHKLATRVLVADDEAITRLWLARLLKSWGYDVVTANDGAEALAILQQKDSPSVALVDWMMPGMQGTEICQQIRQARRSNYIYIVLLTSKDQQSDVIEGLTSGADDYLKKPFDPLELKARLEVASRIGVQRALNDSERRFQAAFESSSAGMAILDLKGRYRQVNQAFCSFLGYEAEEVLAKTCFDVTYQDDLAVARAAFDRLANGDQENHRIEKRYLHRTGVTVWALLTASLIKQDDGTPAYVLAQTADITQKKAAEEALRHSEELFRAIAENANELILMVSTDNVILYASPAYESLLGYSAEDLCGANAFDFFADPDDRTVIREKSIEIIQSGKAHPVQVRIRHKDGSIRTVESHSGAIRDSKGQIQQFVITSRVIDDRLETERILLEREEQLKLLLDSTAEAIYGIDLQGNCTFCNQAFLHMMGYSTMDELLGQNMHRLIHHHREDGSVYAEKDSMTYQAFKLHHATHVDNEVLWRADGTCFPAEYWSYPVRSGEETVGCVVTFVDITDRRRAENALRNAHLQSELFINSVPSILIGLDGERRITRWNHSAADTFGLNREQVLGKALSHCGIKWLDKNIEAEISSWQTLETSHRRENVPFEKDGQPRVLALTASLVSFSPDEPLGLLITGADVTERRTLESQLRQAQKLEAIGQLAAGIAHEINTPIQYVGDNTAFIKESWNAVSKLFSTCREMRDEGEKGRVSDATRSTFDSYWNEADVEYLHTEVPRAIEQALDGVQRVAKIVRAMKEFSHPGSEEKKPLDINRAIETTITVARNEWKYVADVRTTLDNTLPMVPCLAGEFNQAILNMIINAAHAITDVVGGQPGAKGLIHISTRSDGEWAEIKIEDSGSGIPEEIRNRVFEPFFTTKDVGKGTGQGLTLAHTVVVKKHGGQIWFESELGKGTTFFIRLPLTPEGKS